MAEYIERECVLAYFEDADADVLEYDGEAYSMWGFSRRKVIETICSVPTADVEPERHGRWEHHLMPLAFKCSCCGYKATAKEWKFHAMQYCPACGCRMENGKNERNWVVEK